jgi:hypothetical protein
MHMLLEKTLKAKNQSHNYLFRLISGKKHIYRIFASRLRQITDIMPNWRGRIVEKAWQLKEECGHFAHIKSHVTTCLSVY